MRQPSGAQARQPRPGTGHGDRIGGRSRPYYTQPYYYGYSSYPYYGSYGYGYGSPYYSDYYWNTWGASPYYSSANPYRYRYRETGSLRVLVEPSETRVYVDGYYAGVADDFDGLFQRLQLSPGRHEIALKLDGYRTHRVRVYVATDHTIKLKHDMTRGAGEETVEDLTEGRGDLDRRASREEDEMEREDPRVRDLPRDREPSRVDRDEREPSRGARDERELGWIRLDVRPSDASIYVDGEFRGAARRAMSLDLPPGRHRIEVVRPGYKTVEREVEVRPGRTTEINVDLERS